VEREEKKRVLEALILAAPEPLPAARLGDILPHTGTREVRALVEELNREYTEQDRAFEIWEVAGGYQVRTRPEYAGYLQQLHTLRPVRLSAAALETLAVVAYRQPVTRAEVEHVRGVDAGATLRSLVERKLVRIAGHREVPGRPMLYATTRRFLEVFGLKGLEDLPTLRDLEELGGDEMLAALAAGSPGPGAAPPEEAGAPEEPDAEPEDAADPSDAEALDPDVPRGPAGLH